VEIREYCDISLAMQIKIFEEKARKRYDKGDCCWKLRYRDYYPRERKRMHSKIVREPNFYYVPENFYVEAINFLIKGGYIKYIYGLLNSKLASFLFKQYYAGGGLVEDYYRYNKAFLENLLIPFIS